MDHTNHIKRLSQFRPPFLDLFNCVITEADPEAGICKMDFDISTQYCHSGNIVQGKSVL